MNKKELKDRIVEKLIVGDNNCVSFINLIGHINQNTFAIDKCSSFKKYLKGNTIVTPKSDCEHLLFKFSNKKGNKTSYVSMDKYSNVLKLKCTLTGDIKDDEIAGQYTINFNEIVDTTSEVMIQIIYTAYYSLPIVIITDNKEYFDTKDILDVKLKYNFNSLINQTTITTTTTEHVKKSGTMQSYNINDMIESIYTSSSISKETVKYNDKGELIKYSNPTNLISYIKNVFYSENKATEYTEQITMIDGKVIRYELVRSNEESPMIYYFTGRCYFDEKLITDLTKTKELIDSIRSVNPEAKELEFLDFKQYQKDPIHMSLDSRINDKYCIRMIIVKSIQKQKTLFGLSLLKDFSPNIVFSITNDNIYCRFDSHSNIFARYYFEDGIFEYADNDSSFRDNIFTSYIYKNINEVRFRDMFGIPRLSKEDAVENVDYNKILEMFLD